MYKARKTASTGHNFIIDRKQEVFMKGFKKVLLGTMAFGLISSAQANTLAEIFTSGKGSIDNWIGSVMKFGGKAGSEIGQTMLDGMTVISGGNIAKNAAELGGKIKAFDIEMAQILAKESDRITPEEFWKLYVKAAKKAPKLSYTAAEIMKMPPADVNSMVGLIQASARAPHLKAMRLRVEDINNVDLPMATMAFLNMSGGSDQAKAFGKELADFGAEGHSFYKVAGEVDADRMPVFTDEVANINKAFKGQPTDVKVKAFTDRLEKLAATANDAGDPNVKKYLDEFKAKNCYGFYK